MSSLTQSTTVLQKAREPRNRLSFLLYVSPMISKELKEQLEKEAKKKAEL